MFSVQNLMALPLQILINEPNEMTSSIFTFHNS